MELVLFLFVNETRYSVFFFFNLWVIITNLLLLYLLLEFQLKAFIYLYLPICTYQQIFDDNNIYNHWRVCSLSYVCRKRDLGISGDLFFWHVKKLLWCTCKWPLWFADTHATFCWNITVRITAMFQLQPTIIIVLEVHFCELKQEMIPVCHS